MARLNDKAAGTCKVAKACTEAAFFCKNCISWIIQPGGTVGKCDQGCCDPDVASIDIDPFCGLTCLDRTCELFKPLIIGVERQLIGAFCKDAALAEGVNLFSQN